MILQQLEVHRFRNIEPVKIGFHPKVNFFFGDNAQGKTNFIEAVYILCLAKSFKSNDDSELVPFHADDYLIEGEFESESGIKRHVGVMFEKSNGKQIKIDGKRLNAFSKLVGLFPIVILSSSDYAITNGPPAERRRFFNILLSQSSSRFLDDLKKYDKVLKQRNTILGEAASGKTSVLSQIELWNVQLIELGSRIMAARKNIVNEMNPYLSEFYEKITGAHDGLTIDYVPNIALTSEEHIADAFEKTLQKHALWERKRGKSLVGPHRDEFHVMIGDKNLRKFGSRGEHKSAAVSLRATESIILKQKTETSPLLLLDDLYAELDKPRSQNVLNLFEKNSQLFITGTSLDYSALQMSSAFTQASKIFFVKSGVIQHEQV